MEQSEKALSFRHRKGWFIERWVAFLLIIVVVTAVVAIGLIVSYVGRCPSEDIKEFEKLPPFQPKPYVLLPRSIVPDSYDIELQPFFNNFTFSGRVLIRVLCKEPTDNVTLHVSSLKVDDVQLVAIENDGPVPRLTRVSQDSIRDFFIIHLDGKLEAQRRYEVSMKFTGTLNDQLSGFYRSSYMDEDGAKKWLATTQFQPTDARKAFPCFDEPALKATFNITLVHPKNMTSLSNMPKSRTVSRSDGWEADEYNTTVRMSTYLLAFVVSEFASIGEAKFKVWARPNAISSAAYALEIGPKILSFYETFFNISYPLPKTDMIAIPDFSAGAMENWGIITFRETALLYDPKISSISNKQRVATVVSHEIAHQWFGNLVTPKWWDDLWLNEGFASYVEYLGVKSVEPSWEMDQQFVLDELQNVMELDCLQSSHPISQPVGHPDEINEIFDRISYAKGATIIRMMNYFLGNTTFNKGLTNYLNAKAFDNAVQDDLWNFLTKAQPSQDSPIDVKKVMDSWTLQTGFPVVTLIRDYENRNGSISQVRFILDKNANDTVSKTLWELPLTYTHANQLDWEPKTKLWFNKTNGAIEFKKDNLPSRKDWVILNLQQVGYYRVNYDFENWKLILNQLQNDHQKIHVINRAQVLGDAMSLARGGLISYDLALNATFYLGQEKEYLPWDTALNSFAYLSTMLSRTSMYGKWKNYVLEKLEPLYKSLGWEESSDENILRQYLRINILAWACGYDHVDCVRQAKQYFQNWKSNPENMTLISPNLRSVVYCTAIRVGSDKDWDFMWKRYLKTTVASEKDKLMQSLTCTKEPWLISRYIEKSMNPNTEIRMQDGSSVFRSIGRSQFGRDIAFNYIRDQWPHIYKTYGKSAFAISNMIKSVGTTLNTKFELEQLKDFKSENQKQLGAATRAFEQTIENVEDNVMWMKTNFKAISQWLLRSEKK